MRDIATAQLSGNLTRDVELRALPSGADVASLRVAFTTRRRQGEEWVDKTNYMSIDVYGAQARSCAQYLTKGSRIFAEGEIDWREWTTQEGQHRETITLKARSVLFEGSRAQSGATGNGTAQPTTAAAPPATSPPASTPTPAAAAEAASGKGAASPADLPF